MEETRCRLRVEINLESQMGPLEMGNGILVVGFRRKAGENSGPNTLQVVLRLQGSPISHLLEASAGLGFIVW